MTLFRRELGDMRVCMILANPELNLVVNLVAFMLIPEVPAPHNFLYSCSPILSYSTL